MPSTNKAETPGITGDVVIVVPRDIGKTAHDRLVQVIMPIDTTPIDRRLGWDGLSSLRASTLPGIRAVVTEVDDQKGGKKTVTTFLDSRGAELLTVKTIRDHGIIMFNNIDLPEAR